VVKSCFAQTKLVYTAAFDYAESISRSGGGREVCAVCAWKQNRFPGVGGALLDFPLYSRYIIYEAPQTNEVNEPSSANLPSAYMASLHSLPFRSAGNICEYKHPKLYKYISLKSRFIFHTIYTIFCSPNSHPFSVPAQFNQAVQNIQHPCCFLYRLSSQVIIFVMCTCSDLCFYFIVVTLKF